jgi:hypothetical protein
VTKEDTEEKSKAVVRVEASPRDLTRQKEKRAFTIFKGVLSFLTSKMGLAEDFAKAKIHREEAEAEVKVEEASKLVAETDRIRLDTMRGLVELIDANFNEMDKDTKMSLKLAVLLRDNPQLKAQVEVVSKMLSDLKDKRDLRVEFLNNAEGSSGE